MTLLDQARGAYVRSPKFVRQGLRSVVGLVPTSLKFGGTYQRWRQTIARARIDPAFSAAEQEAALRALFVKAYSGSPYYRALMDQAFGASFDPHFVSLSSLGRMPIVHKVSLRAAGLDALAAPRSTVDRVETSGSNAEAPFSFYLDKNRSPREMAFVYDAWSRVGFTEKHARACFRGFALDPKGQRISDWDPALRELRLSVYPMTADDAEDYLDLIDARGLEFIYGYPSAIELFCRHLRRLGRTPKRQIRGILPISEPLFDHQRRFIAATLGNPGFACFYGLSEKVLFAVDVDRQPGTYEFDPLYGVAELVDAAGHAVTEIGAEGRLVGTGFLSTGMPFIRYDTGDSARLVQLPCPGNGQRLRVRDLTPRRKPNFLVTDDGQRVVTTDMTPEDPAFFAGIAEFQLFQERPGEVLFRYIPTAGGGVADAQRMVSYFSAASRRRLNFAVEQVAQLASGRGGKRAFIDQRLDLSRY